MKKTLVLGASPNPSRYSNMAVERLVSVGEPVVPLGIRKGTIAGEDIVLGMPELDDVETITLYVGPARQPQYYDYLLGLNPSRIIFNPGTENAELMRLAREKGIESVVACTLVMISTGSYRAA